MATVAAAMIARARRDIVRHLTESGATSPDTAVEFQPERRIGRRVLARMVRSGAVIQTGPDRYYFDRAAYVAWRRATLKRVGAVLGAGAAVIGAIVALTG